MKKAICLAVLLGGCATTERVWMHSDNTEERYRVDRGQCLAQGSAAFQGPQSIQAAMIFNGCMQGKGWYQVEQPRR